MWFAVPRKRDLVWILVKSAASGVWEARCVLLGLLAAGAVACLLRR